MQSNQQSIDPGRELRYSKNSWSDLIRSDLFEPLETQMKGLEHMSRFSFPTMVVVVFLVAAHPSWAQNSYVTDSLRITLRTGPSVDNKIITMLSSGRAVEVLETSGEWSRVRIQEGDEITQEGWVLSRFLMTRLPWEVRAKTLIEENSGLKEKLSTMEKELSETTRLSRELGGKLKNTSGALAKVEKDFANLKKGAADYLALRTKYETVRSELETGRKNLRQLTRENEELRSSERIKWFITGASVVVFGLIFGLILGKKQRKRRSSIYE
jgi:SH3 domain protein